MKLIVTSALVFLAVTCANSQVNSGQSGQSGVVQQNPIRPNPGTIQTPTNPAGADLPPGLQQQLPPGLSQRDQLPPGLATRTNAFPPGVTNQFGGLNASNRFRGLTNQFGGLNPSNRFTGLTNMPGTSTNLTPTSSNRLNRVYPDNGNLPPGLQRQNPPPSGLQNRDELPPGLSNGTNSSSRSTP
jgi:hypothetical protein